MKVRFATQLLGAIFLSISVGALGVIDKPLVIKKLTVLDNRFMTSQRALIDNLTKLNFGRGFNGTKARDLALLQRTLDEGLVTSSQTLELQAMGIILGDLLATELDMHWVIYEDKLGRTKALRYKETQDYLFPVTMISRRREADNREPVAQIYQKAYDIIAARKPARRFK